MTDIMSPETRSRVMSRIRGRNTGPERALAKLLKGAGLKFGRHGKHLPGRPDFYFPSCKVAVCVDGDFWHGWRFPARKHKLTPFWRKKIGGNRARDRRNMAKLRRLGWRPVRIWEHQMERCPEMVLARVLAALRTPPYPVSRGHHLKKPRR